MPSTGSVEAYLDFHPFREWDVDKWDERSATLNTAFHRRNIYFTPLVGNTLTMPEGVGRENYWYVDNKIVPAHVNQNPIGWYQQSIGPLYLDVMRRRVQARNRYGSKVQYNRRDQMVSRYGAEPNAFIDAALRDQLAYNIAAQQEKVSLYGILDNAVNNYLYDGSTFELGTADFSDIPQSSAGVFDITILEETALRMATRSINFADQWGTYAQPVPGSNFRGSALIMMTTGTYWSIVNTPESEYMTDLYALQDERIINGGKVQYRKFSTISDTGMAQVLWNAGQIGKQVAVTEPINWGDGAPDPDTTQIDNVYMMGQASATHYVQCSDFDDGDYSRGDRVTIHVKRTDSWGITDGVDFSDGKSLDIEVYSADHANNRITFRYPITDQYDSAMTYSALGGVDVTDGTCYAYITKAQHIHPVIVMGARETVQFVRRPTPSGELISFYAPTDEHFDYPSHNRVTAEWFGEINQWNPDPIEVFWCAGPSASYGAVGY